MTAPLRPQSAETRFAELRKKVIERIMSGRTINNFAHVPTVVRALEWVWMDVDQVFKEDAEAYARAAAPQARSIDGKFGFKDGKIVNLVSGQEIPDDEPLFLLRARDHHAYDTLMHYLMLAESDCNDLHQEGIKQVIRKFITFRKNHPERMKQPGITRHLKLDESCAAAPAAPLPQEE